jgi:hypothetical protein
MERYSGTCLAPFVVLWCPEPGSNRYAPFQEAADFKSDVSTNFTIRAPGRIAAAEDTRKQNSPATWVAGLLVLKFGGAFQSRTGLDGFAIRCITALLTRRLSFTLKKKGKALLSLFQMLEREKSLELSTSTLARLRSTN